MYVCRDAGVNWEFAICEVMIAIGFVHGRASAYMYRHLENSSVYGYMEMTLYLPVTSINVRWFFVKLQEFWVVTNRGILGPSGYHDCVQGIRVLGRLVEWTTEGITWDPRPAEPIRKRSA